MTCALGLPELASRNPFIKQLEELGYSIDFVGGYFVIYGVPYLDKAGSLCYGDWISPLDLVNGVIDPPSNHQAWWRGERLAIKLVANFGWEAVLTASSSSTASSRTTPSRTSCPRTTASRVSLVSREGRDLP